MAVIGLTPMADAQPPGELLDASIRIVLHVLITGAVFFRCTGQTFADII
jgi:hypothetical protein